MGTATTLTRVPRRKQKGLYWAPGTPDGYGDHTFGTGVEIDCRYDEELKVVKDAGGNEVVSAATVYPDRPLANGGWFWEGAEDDLDSAYDLDSEPTGISGARQIVATARIPDVRNRRVLHIAYLK